MINSQALSQALSNDEASILPANPFANLYLAVLAVATIGTALCTAVLVAWPVYAKLIMG